MAPPVFVTKGGIRYLREPGVILIASTQFNAMNREEYRAFLENLDARFEEGYNDFIDFDANREINEEAELVQLAGQLCYLSFGEKRTPFAENDKYIQRILEAGHGSVLEHSSFSVLLYGIDRACTHELVRHRAGMAYSQVSQRYVGGEHLRFVLPFEYQGHDELMERFRRKCERDATYYAEQTELLKTVIPQYEGETATDWRKRIQSCAREGLPNSTEAPILVTGNARAWRHVFGMRCGMKADVRIRRPMVEALKVLREKSENLFADFEITKHSDGSEFAVAKWPKP